MLRTTILPVLLAVLSARHADAQITEFCFGDTTDTPCPCGNASALGSNDGCMNSLGRAGRLRGSGSVSLQSDTLVLAGSQMTPNWYVYYQGSAAASPGYVFGDGVRCVPGSLVRLHWPMCLNAMDGSSQFPTSSDVPVSVAGNVTAPGTRYYQIFYRDASPTFCTANTFTTTNALAVVWSP